MPIQFVGYRFKGKWKLAPVVHRLPGSPVCVTVDGLKTSKTYIFRTRHQICSNLAQPWVDWSAASDTGQTSADLGAVVSAQVLGTQLAARHRGRTSSANGDSPTPTTLVPSPASDGLRQRRGGPSPLPPLLSASAEISTASTPEEAEPPPPTPIAEGLPASGSTWLERRTHQVAHQEQVALDQDELWQTAWHTSHRRSKHDAEELREFVPLILLLICTVKLAEVQILSMTGCAYFITVGVELVGGLRELNPTSWSLTISAALLLIAFMNWLIGGGRTVDPEPGETQMGVSWIGWACSTLWSLLHWVIAAFKWRPNDLGPTPTADHRYSVDQIDEVGAVTTDQVLGGSENQAASWNWVDHPLVTWRQLWVDNPAGTFLYDHWIAATLATWVIGISCCSLLYSFLQSDFGIAKLVRRVIWSTRYWLKAIVRGSFAFTVMRSGMQDYWFQSAYVNGYIVLWLSSVLWVATLDSISDALGRPSTFTVDRVAILFASMFVIGLPVLFWVAAHGIGWQIVSPLALGLGVDGFGRAFLSEPLRDLAYLPIRLLLSVLELPILWVLRDLIMRLVRSRLLAQVVDSIVASREPCVAAAGSLYILPKGLERFGQCQTWTDPSCIVGMAHTCVGICGILAAIELVSKDNNGRPRHPVFCTAFAPFLAAVRVVLTVGLPRSAHWVYKTVLRCCRVMSACWHVVSQFFSAAWSVMCRAARSAWNPVCRIASSVWTVVCRAASAVWTAVGCITSSVWSVVCHIASAVRRVGRRITRDVWTVIYRFGNDAYQFARVLWRPVWTLMCHVGVSLRNIAARLGRAVWRYCRHRLTVVYRFVQQFTRAYWRLLPTGLAVQTCIRFGLAILRSPPPEASAALGFLLASVAVGIIAAILVRDLFMRTFDWSPASNRQYIATDRTSAYYEEQSLVDNMLLYVDLGAVATARWIVTNIGSICRILIERGSRWLAQALHWAIRKTWQIALWIYTWLLLPVIKRIETIVLTIWGSPVLSSAAALGTIKNSVESVFDLEKLLICHHKNAQEPLNSLRDRTQQALSGCFGLTILVSGAGIYWIACSSRLR